MLLMLAFSLSLSPSMIPMPFSLLAGISSGLLLGLGLAKWLNYSELVRSGLGRWALLVGAVECLIAAFALLAPRSTWTWVAAGALGASLAGISLFGPSIPHCHCLGAFSEMTPRARTVLSLGMLALFLETARKLYVSRAFRA